MLKFHELQEKRSRLVAEMRAITDKPEGQGGDLSEGQAQRFDQLKAELESTEKAMGRQALLDEVERRMSGGVQVAGGDRPDPRRELRQRGEFLRAVAAAQTPGGQINTRAAGLNEAIASEGGFLVDEDFSLALMQDVASAALVAPLCRKITLTSGANSIRLPMVDESSRADGSRYGGAAAYWVPESGEITASKPKFRQLSITPNKLACLYHASDELLQDAPALAQALSGFFAGEMSFKVDDGIINGSGAGQPLGIVNCPALVTVSKESGQAADTVLWENVVKMWARLWSRSRANAVWLVGPGVESQLYSMTLTVGTSGIPVYMPAGGASGQPYSTLFTRPVLPCEQANPLGEKGDIILFDPTQYLLVDKGTPQGASSIAVRFEYAETAFRLIYRVDGLPTWAQPLTPFKGSDTVSPYVTLEAR